MIRQTVNEINKNLYLLMVLVKKDIKKKYKDSYLGLLWTFLSPLLNMVVMSIIFSSLFSRSITNFPVYVLSGRIFYDLFHRSTMEALKSIPGASPIIKKIYVPGYIITFSKILSNSLISIMSLPALAVVMLFTRAAFSIDLLALPVLLIIFLVFTTGIGLIVASANVFFRDMEHIYGVVMTIVMYLSAIFYPASIIPGEFQIIFWLNPMFRFIEAFRYPIYYGSLPGPGLMIYCIGVSVLALVVGGVIFRRNQGKFVHYL